MVAWIQLRKVVVYSSRSIGRGKEEMVKAKSNRARNPGPWRSERTGEKGQIGSSSGRVLPTLSATQPSSTREAWHVSCSDKSHPGFAHSQIQKKLRMAGILHSCSAQLRVWCTSHSVLDQGGFVRKNFRGLSIGLNIGLFILFPLKTCLKRLLRKWEFTSLVFWSHIERKELRPQAWNLTQMNSKHFRNEWLE